MVHDPLERFSRKKGRKKYIVPTIVVGQNLLSVLTVLLGHSFTNTLMGHLTYM